MRGEELRGLMRRFPSGVAVVTVDLEGERIGLTVSSLVSLSLEPPLVGVAVSRQAALHELLRRARVFGASLLGERQGRARGRSGRWHEHAQRDMMGMSSPEWSRYMHDVIGLRESPEEISAEVVRRMGERYRERLPLLPGAVEAVERLAARWPLGLASSSNRPLIDLVLEVSGLGRFFAATVSSEEVSRGKPAPDVFLEAARRLGVA